MRLRTPKGSGQVEGQGKMNKTKAENPHTQALTLVSGLLWDLGKSLPLLRPSKLISLNQMTLMNPSSQNILNLN